MSGKRRPYEINGVRCQDCGHQWKVVVTTTPRFDALECPKCEGIGVYTGALDTSLCPEGSMMITEEGVVPGRQGHMVKVNW